MKTNLSTYHNFSGLMDSIPNNNVLLYDIDKYINYNWAIVNNYLYINDTPCRSVQIRTIEQLGRLTILMGVHMLIARNITIVVLSINQQYK